MPELVDSRILRLEANGASVELLSPLDHKLDHYRRIHPYYDARLPKLCALVDRQRPSGTMIDVGANIGDSIALARLEGCRSHFVAVEPSQQMMAHLLLNLESGALGNVSPVRAFVGARELASGVPTTTLEVLAGGRDAAVSLIKLDTDGYDGAILESAVPYLTEVRPVLWAEIETTSALDDHRWEWTLRRLAHGGAYDRLAVFDNYGFLYCAGSLLGRLQSLLDLVRYCRKGREVRHNTIYHVDVALVPQQLPGLLSEFVERMPEWAD